MAYSTGWYFVTFSHCFSSQQTAFHADLLIALEYKSNIGKRGKPIDRLVLTSPKVCVIKRYSLWKFIRENMLRADISSRCLFAEFPWICAILHSRWRSVSSLSLGHHQRLTLRDAITAKTRATAHIVPPLLTLNVILSQTRPHLIRFSYFIFLAVIMKQKGPRDPGWLVFMRWRIVQRHPCRKAVAYII